MSQCGTVQFIIFAVCVIGIQGDPRYPWDTTNGDTEIFTDTTISLTVPVYYYMEEHSTVTIETLGQVVVGGGSILPAPNGRREGNTFYRVVTNDAAFLEEITTNVKVYDPSFQVAEQVIVVTWIDVTTPSAIKFNTFQLALVSGGGTSYLIFNYFDLQFGNLFDMNVAYLQDGQIVNFEPINFDFRALTVETNVDILGRYIIRATQVPGECVITNDDRIPCSIPFLGSDVCEKLGCCFEMDRGLNGAPQCYKPTDSMCTCVTTPDICDTVGSPECMLGYGETCGFGQMDITWDCFLDGNRSVPAMSVTNNVKCCDRCVGGTLEKPSDCVCGEVAPNCNN